MRIYIAGPYTADSDSQIQKNVNNAIDTAILVFKKGHYPYIPHLTHWIEIRNMETNQGLKWEDYIEMDRIWLENCDALLYLGSSKGADIELNHAKKEGKPIFYSITEIPTEERKYRFKEYSD